MTTRRKFLKDTAMLSAGIALYGCSDAKGGVFSPSERECLISMSEQIVPADKIYGGATDAGVINYIENWVSKYWPETLPIYKSGVDSVQKASKRLYGKKFQELDFDTQTKFMRAMETSKLAREDWPEISQKDFFEEILMRTMQGFYGAPRHGGNKNFMSYKMLGLDMPVVTGQNRYGMIS